uniref:Uncharacterized protein n=1 Tax=Arundo donax TaxID=35708 RepID=A0A0A9GC48_ARUDO
MSSSTTTISFGNPQASNITWGFLHSSTSLASSTKRKKKAQSTAAEETGRRICSHHVKVL